MSGVTQEFPSDFPIKVMGRHDGDLRALTQAIIERHAGPLPDRACAHAPARTAISWP